MDKRPDLSTELDSAIFRNFYYRKDELTAFCKANNLPASGGKIEITDRIAHYLDTGEVLKTKSTARTRSHIGQIEESALIEPGFVCTEKHRAFFKDRIGKGFTYNVAFQNWLKDNSGKTYAQAIEAYHDIMEQKKKGQTTIDRQFEYNAYIRAFHVDNTGRSLKDAIQCWKYKKALPGHNRYERADLVALEHPQEG
jgi:dTDP-glucose pyrophosphorylase